MTRSGDKYFPVLYLRDCGLALVIPIVITLSVAASVLEQKGD